MVAGAAEVTIVRRSLLFAMGRADALSVAQGMSGMCSTRYVRFLEAFQGGGIMDPEIRVRIAEALGRYGSGALSCLEAAEVLGMSERHFRRLRDRSRPRGRRVLWTGAWGGPRGAARRLTRSNGPGAVRTRYWDFTAKHFHEHLVRDHGFQLCYTWTKIRLQEAGLVKKARGRGAHRRPRRALPGIPVPGRLAPPLAGSEPRDLIATMDDATGEVVSAFLVEEEGTFSAFAGFGKRSRRRASSAPSTPTAAATRQPQGRRQGRQGAPDPGRPGPRPARHRAHPLLLARGQGAHRAALQPCKGASPRRRLAGIPPWTRPTAISPRPSCPPQ